MVQPLKALPLLKKQKQQTGTEEHQCLMEQLRKTRVLIEQAYTTFNSVSDPDLIESCVFEINALQARYSYYLRRVKEIDRGS